MVLVGVTESLLSSLKFGGRSEEFNRKPAIESLLFDIDPVDIHHKRILMVGTNKRIFNLQLQ